MKGQKPPPDGTMVIVPGKRLVLGVFGVHRDHGGDHRNES